MKKTIFKGMATAMVTPMTPEGVDYEALGAGLLTSSWKAASTPWWPLAPPAKARP